MTRKGAQFIIECLSERVCDIQDIRERLINEEVVLRARIIELAKIEDPIEPQRIIPVG